MKNKNLLKSIEEVKKYLFLTAQQPDKGEVFVKFEDFKTILSLYQNHIREEVEGMKKDFTIILATDGKEAMLPKEWEMKGYNQALDDVKEIIK